MAILSTPYVSHIDAFDPSFSKDIEFDYTGSQAVKNRAVITDNETNIVVYDSTISTNKLVHTIPKNTLLAGKQYLIQIQVFDIVGNNSNLSDYALFYCFTTPMFSFNEIEEPYRAANITLFANYYQEQGETLKYHQYMLYDGNNNLLNSSDVYYGDITNHTFYGLQNNANYYVRCIAETTHGMSLDTGKKSLNVIYNTIPANILFQLENHRCSGYISLLTNMLVIGYELENDNFIFNDDGSVTLWDNSITYQDGFSVEGDFVLYIEAKELPIGTFLKTADDEFTLSILDVCGCYYCELKSGNYVIYTLLPEARLTTSDGSILTNQLGQKIEIINLDYENDDYVVFELKRINNIFGLNVYYKNDI